MQKITTKEIATTAMIAAVYAALTIATSGISFGVIQLRLAEALMLLAFVDKKYAPGLVLGCFIANCFSPFGLLDVVFGTGCTIVALWGITKHSKTLLGASLWPVVCNAFVGVELYILGECPILFGMATVALGEFIVVTIIGYPVFKQLMKNQGFMERARLA